MDPYVEFAARLQTVNYFQDHSHMEGKRVGSRQSYSLPAYFPVASCASMFAAGTSLHAIAITVSECIFALRCYAMWNRNKIIFVISLFTTVTFSSPPLPVIHGCYKTGANTILFATFVVIMVSEAIIVCSTLFRAHQHFRYGHNALIHSLARDGVFYCLCMFGMSVANLFVIFALPIQYSEMLNTYQAVMHTILACRMQLHLRKIDRTIYRVCPTIELELRPMSFSSVEDVPEV
ncbi:hypothetical protein BJ138DRAFT_861734 [Hygrophoropsis aurantiaca]|uniref:Uncharacterized protein n=1 Tax=Hygrophoropsis aurantiaca TaxID=72124 RepID=A0ACB8AF77_9AGAM|nr:hypothetical protein BJ138DRAFT_861734 [Hygrophoropsis aurantiaca]